VRVCRHVDGEEPAGELAFARTRQVDVAPIAALEETAAPARLAGGAKRALLIPLGREQARDQVVVAVEDERAKALSGATICPRSIGRQRTTLARTARSHQGPT
jgi:hypothetical protein